MKKEPHIWDLMDYLDALDGKEIRVTVRDTPEAQADFDRKVRDAVDRLHRRKMISES